MKTQEEINAMYDAANEAARAGDIAESDRLHADAVWEDEARFEELEIRRVVREQHCSRERARIILNF